MATTKGIQLYYNYLNIRFSLINLKKKDPEVRVIYWL